MASKSIETLIPDIYSMLEKVIDGESVEVSDEFFAKLGGEIALKIKQSLQARGDKVRKTKTLYMSEYGRPCWRQLWYDIRPEYKENREKITPQALIKFLYGDILEELVLALAELSGHEVTCQQKECEVELPNGWKLRGRMDAKIDGQIVDVKSTTTYGIKKFQDKNALIKDDPFGYMDQLKGYLEAEYPDGDVPKNTKVAFVVIDKALGHLQSLSLDVDDFASKEELEDKRAHLVHELEQSTPPDRAFEDKPDGKSGNRILPTSCSYCGYKKECWKDSNNGKGLRGFFYSDKPRFFTQVVKEPKVDEFEV